MYRLSVQILENHAQHIDCDTYGILGKRFLQKLCWQRRDGSRSPPAWQVPSIMPSTLKTIRTFKGMSSLNVFIESCGWFLWEYGPHLAKVCPHMDTHQPANNGRRTYLSSSTGKRLINKFRRTVSISNLKPSDRPSTSLWTRNINAVRESTQNFNSAPPLEECLHERFLLWTILQSSVESKTEAHWPRATKRIRWMD